MNTYIKKFHNELRILKENLAEGNKLLIEDFIPCIEQIAEIFSKQGHSGSSAPAYANAVSNAIKNVLMFQPLSPITGNDNEWGTEAGSDQNSRCSAVFKDGDNGSYYLNAIVWQGEDKYDTFTGTIEGVSSRQFVKFPFTPKTFYIDVYRELYDERQHNKGEVVQCGSGDYVYFIKDRNQLKAVAEYYDMSKRFKVHNKA